MEIMDKMYDQRGKSISIMTRMKVSEYLSFAKEVYEEHGRLDGQREKIKTTTALRIRKRMSNDFLEGAILPPVVVGVLLVDEEHESMSNMERWDEQALSAAIQQNASRIAIIDGMQRTSVFLEHFTSAQEKEIRVEFWVANRTESLTYRMLVLNTGQVPWNLRRQIEVVYAPLLTEIEHRLHVNYSELSEKIKLYRIGEGHRTEAGQFQADDIIEMYIAFGLKKEKVDTQSVLADEFSRLDMIESVSHHEDFLDTFVVVFSLLCRLDLSFGNLFAPIGSGKFKSGKDLFQSIPACVGFFTAAAQTIYGRPGMIKDEQFQRNALKHIERRVNDIILFCDGLNPDGRKEFLAFDLLNEAIGRSSSKIGDFEREFFREAFRLLLMEDVGKFTSMMPCWRAF